MTAAIWLTSETLSADQARHLVLGVRRDHRDRLADVGHHVGDCGVGLDRHRLDGSAVESPVHRDDHGVGLLAELDIARQPDRQRPDVGGDTAYGERPVGLGVEADLDGRRAGLAREA